MDAWDYQWAWSCFINNGLIATSSKNLVRNIGFGEDATHTTNGELFSVANEEIPFPLIHPKAIFTNKTMDKLLYRNVFGWMSFNDKLKNKKYVSAFLKQGILKHLKKS